MSGLGGRSRIQQKQLRAVPPSLPPYTFYPHAGYLLTCLRNIIPVWRVKLIVTSQDLTEEILIMVLIIIFFYLLIEGWIA
jgi:hypothetical protein